MVDPVTIGVGCNKWLKDADTRMVQLYTQDYNNNWFTLHDDDGGDYQVPVGKQYIILQVTSMLIGTATTLAITQHNVINSAGGIQLFAFYGTGGAASLSLGKIDCYATVDAGMYVNCLGRSPLVMLGIETTV